MRKIMICAVVALTAFAAVSCQKEDSFTSSKSERICTFTFADSVTKTVLDADGRTPLWKVGDVIRLLDDKSYEDITLTSEIIAGMKGGKVSVTSTLTGDPVYAVYPASATDMTSCYNKLNLKIPAIQDGTFASANICISMNEDPGVYDFVFKNAASIVKVSQNSVESGILGVKIEAENKIAGSYAIFINDDFTYDPTPQFVGESNQITVCAKSGLKDYYFAVPATVETGAVKITYLKADTYATESKASKTFAVNKIYNLGSIDAKDLLFKEGRGALNGHEFIKVAGLKWATDNLAISSDGKKPWLNSGHMIGDFFRWGETELIYDEIWIRNLPANDNDPGFHFTTYYEDKQAYETFWNGWKDNFDFDKIGEGNKLLPEYDPVVKYWGSSWHMPNGGETNDYVTLFNATYTVFDNTNYGCYLFEPDASHPAGKIVVGFNGLKAQDALLYFPACGWGLAGAVSNTGYQVKLWTNHYTPGAKKKDSLITSFAIIYDEIDVEVAKWDVPSEKVPMASKYGWWLGYSVRPVSN